MEQSKQPRKATPEQNANVVKQVSDIVINRIIDEEVEKQLNSPEARLKIEMMAVYRQLSENTAYTKDASLKVIDELSKVTDLVLLYKSRLEQVEKDNKDFKNSLINAESKFHALENKFDDILEKQAKRIKLLQVEVYKLEKLK